MRISITKKILGMVIIPIFVICVVAGFISSNIARTIITDEIELQLKTSAYSISQTLQYVEHETEMSREIQKLYDYTGIDITVFNGDERIASTIPGAIGTAMDKSIYKNLQSGEDYFSTDVKVNGKLYFGYYVPIIEDSKLSGVTFAGIPQTEATKTIETTMIKIIGCLLGYGFVFSMIALFFVRKMIRTLKALEYVIGTLLANDLVTKHEKYEFEHDEIEELSDKTIDFSEQLKQIVTRIKVASSDLKTIASNLRDDVQFTNSTCTQISCAIENVANGAVSQAEDTSHAANKINEMSMELNKIKNNADMLHDIADSMHDAKENALETLKDLQKINDTMSGDIDSTGTQVNATRECVDAIKMAIEVIQDIASQTNLLSLNASIEAAHAGEHGKGFAVVAEEIGKLAYQSTQSSVKIEEVLKQLVTNYDAIVDNVKGTLRNMVIQNGKLVDTQNVFIILERDINSTVEGIEDIVSKVTILTEGIEEMVDIIANLSAISEENSASTQETMASIQELDATIAQVYEKAQNVNGSADALANELSMFKTE